MTDTFRIQRVAVEEVQGDPRHLPCSGLCPTIEPSMDGSLLAFTRASSKSSPAGLQH